LKCPNCKGSGEVPNINIGAIESILKYLNVKAGTAFRKTTKATQRCIQARINEGYSSQDFIDVINVKTKQWLPDPRMCGYLRPETLFGTKFEGYLNEAKAVKPIQRNTLVY
jgi:uncharacterized phage protein (TIGR02220 family)